MSCHARSLRIALAAACLLAAVAVPTAGAAGKRHGTVSSASSALQVRADATITKKRLARDLRVVDRRSKANRRSIARLRRNLRTLGEQLRGAITGGDKSIDEKVNGIVSTVAPILVQLGDAAKQLEAGLKQLAAATSAGFGEVETALTDISDFVGAQEYGAMRAYIDVPDAAPGDDIIETPALVSSDVPDTGNPATVSAQFPVDLTAVSPALPESPVFLRAAMRTAEVEGDGNPAGQAGAVLIITCGGGTCDDDAGAGPFEPGAVVCTESTDEETFELPDGTTRDEALTDIQLGDDILDPGAPTQGDTDPLQGDSCAIDGGGLYLLAITSQFSDLPTSLDPGAKD